MRLQKLNIKSRFKNLDNFEIDFSTKEGITVLIGNNGSGKSNILEAISSIFAGLYDRRYNPTFSYELVYNKDAYKVEIKFDNVTDMYEFLNFKLISYANNKENFRIERVGEKVHLKNP